MLSDFFRPKISGGKNKKNKRKGKLKKRNKIIPTREIPIEKKNNKLELFILITINLNFSY